MAFVDPAARERAADDHAAATVGRDALARAIRRLAAERPAGSEEAGPFAGCLLAPYRLFFGGILYERAHPSVEERVERLYR